MMERIAVDTPPQERYGHEFRYRLARGWIGPDDTVLDAGCGIGYGAPLVQPCHYVGVDIADVVDDQYRPAGKWLLEDLSSWVPRFVFHVALCFETFEHVDNPQRLIDICCFARDRVICSVPIVPTVGGNPYHQHDFTMWDLPRLFDARGWSLEQCVLQPTELSAIYVFRRHSK